MLHTAAQEYVDVETDEQTGRAAFGEMVAYLNAEPSVRVMLVEETDRLYRNLKDCVTRLRTSLPIKDRSSMPSSRNTLCQLSQFPGAPHAAALGAFQRNPAYRSRTLSPRWKSKHGD